MQKVAIDAVNEMAGELDSPSWFNASEVERNGVLRAHQRLDEGFGFSRDEQAAFALGLRYAGQQFALATRMPGATNRGFLLWLKNMSAITANEACLNGFGQDEEE